MRRTLAGRLRGGADRLMSAGGSRFPPERVFLAKKWRGVSVLPIQKTPWQIRQQHAIRIDESLRDRAGGLFILDFRVDDREVRFGEVDRLCQRFGFRDGLWAGSPNEAVHG
jgi:hypothetical protein